MMMRVATLFALGCVLFQVAHGLGSLSETKPADSEVNNVIAGVRSEITQKLGGEAVAVSYKTQLVSGTNYFVKVQTGGGAYAHVRIYRALDGTTSLVGVQTGKSAGDDITYF